MTFSSPADLKYVSLPENPTEEQIDQAIKELEQKVTFYDVRQLALKTFINSIYGATGNPHFIGYNVDVAEAVTQQGAELLVFSMTFIDDYFLNHWHLDTELHEKIGAKNVKKIEKPITIYGDTDSNYVTFEEVLEKCDYEDSHVDFILKIYENRLVHLFKEKFDKYADRYGVTNLQDFELETIAESFLISGKKHYMQKVKHVDGWTHEKSKFKVKGMKLAQKGVPKFIKPHLQEIAEYVLDKGYDLDEYELQVKIQKIKDIFMLQAEEDLCDFITLNDYDKYISNDYDKESLIYMIGDNCPHHVRASAHHNLKLNTVDGGKYRKKYQLLKSGDKVCVYHCELSSTDESKLYDCFAYSPGEYPIEIAPKMDKEKQFYKKFIEPVNEFVTALGINPVNRHLLVDEELELF